MGEEGVVPSSSVAVFSHLPDQSLPPGVLQHIVETVTAEVTKKLGGAQGPTTEDPMALSNQGVVGQAETSLQGAIASFNPPWQVRPCFPTSPQPKDIFSSISIPANGRVPLKLKTKMGGTTSPSSIWLNKELAAHRLPGPFSSLSTGSGTQEVSEGIMFNSPPFISEGLLFE